MEHVPVLVLGGGVVGLTAALCLLHHGVRPLLVEKHPGTSIHPRSRGINARSGEIYRQLGLFDAIREAGASLQPAFRIYTGATFDRAMSPVPRRLDAPERRLGIGIGLEALTPTPSCRCTQDVLEPLLRAAAVERGADVRFATRLASFSQSSEGVLATLEGGTTIRADYLIAADGVKGGTRERLGIGTTGAGTLGHLLNVLVDVDLADFVRGREPSQVLVENDAVRGLWLSIDSRSRWTFHIAGAPEIDCRPLVEAGLGLPGLAPRILGALPWQPSVRIAERLREGRVFLAGDAAHQMPPWGGQGANSGIAEVHNLAWKLAAVLRGEDPALLDTYERERLPIGKFAAEKSGEAAGRDGLPRIGADGKPAVLETMRSLAFVSGLAYAYGDADERFDGRVGSRVPHAWVERAGERISILDLFGRGFVRLARGPHPGAIDVEALAGSEAWCAQVGLGRGDTMLVRPDGFVAGRAHA